MIKYATNVSCKTLLYFEKLTQMMILGTEMRNENTEKFCIKIIRLFIYKVNNYSLFVNNYDL